MTKPKIEFNAAKHTYTVDGAKVPSVTGILGKVIPKPGLPWWSQGQTLQNLCEVHLEERFAEQAFGED